VEYPDPWQGPAATDQFWAALRERVVGQGDAPPALVYLVHPHFPTGFKDPEFGARLKALVAESGSQAIFAVDQTYTGFTSETADDRLLEGLASTSESVVLVRSLSKVEGLAALRLGYALAAPPLARELSSGLPFAGGLYISELALTGAVAALTGPAVGAHREAVLSFYRAEQAWFAGQLEDLGLVVSVTPCPYFVARGPSKVLERARKAGAALQLLEYPAGGGRAPEGEAHVCVLVSDRASNEETLRMVREALQAESDRPSWMPRELGSLFGMGS